MGALSPQPSDGLQIGALIQQLRKQRQWTIVDLARASGVNKATISSLERGAENFRRETIAKLARALGTTAEELLQQLPIGPIDAQRLRLLMLWDAILPEHRHLVLDAAERVAKSSQEVQRLTESVATKIRHIEHLEAVAQRLGLQARQSTEPVPTPRLREKRRRRRPAV